MKLPSFKKPLLKLPELKLGMSKLSNPFMGNDRVKSRLLTSARALDSNSARSVLIVLLVLAASVFVFLPDGNSKEKDTPILMDGSAYKSEIIQIADSSKRNAATVKVERGAAEPPPMTEEYMDIEETPSGDFVVQAVLSPKSQTVIASGIDARIKSFNFKNGDRFKEGDVLIEYDCSLDAARLKEAQSRVRVTEKQLDAYKKLVDLKSASDMEMLVAKENNEQNKAIVAQIQARLRSCSHIAPYDGRVTNKMASAYEYVQPGRVLMELASSEPLQAEFLIPSKWLRWLNIDTGLVIYIEETERNYEARIVSIHGEVDPVSQSVQVVAEMEEYHEELLPGMSGRATFDPNSARKANYRGGFLGLMLMPFTDGQ